MRKLLLATVAGLGAWGASDASAQTAPAPAPVQSGAVFSPYNGGVALPAANAPNPGTVVVRLNGRFRFYAYGAFDRDTDTQSVNGAPVAKNKLASYGVGEYARLYPGFDGVAANGLKYGASLEIRQDQSSGAGGGAYGSISAQDRARSELYYRRAWGYLGTNTLGTIRVGATDQPTSLYLTGNFENFNDGGWNGDLPSLIAGNVAPTWVFPDIGNNYTTSKVVYLSPQLFGFDMGASYEPNTGNVSAQNNCGAGSPVGGSFVSPIVGGGVAGPGCDRLSSTTTNSETARRTNTFDVLLRYRGSFGPVGVVGTAAYMTSSHVQDSSGLAFNNNPLAATGARYNYDGLSVGDFGAAVTIAGLTVGGHYDFGRWNGYVGGLVPKGLPDGDAWIAGASYTIGPVIVGGHWFVAETAGDLGNAFLGRQRREQGVALGGTYSLAPGVSIFLSGLWGERKQNGFNFITGAGVSAANGTGGDRGSNKVTSSAVSLGTAFSW